MRRVRITVSANADLMAGWEFYETLEEGVGDYFLASIQADISALSTLHGIHPLRCGFYRMLAAKFKCGIFYRDFQDETVIEAILAACRT